MMMPGWGFGGYGGGFGWLGPLFMILFLGLIVTGVVLLIRYLITQGQPEFREDSALEILKRRYARSEISSEEYEEKRNALL